jgi:hypothetical protein
MIQWYNNLDLCLLQHVWPFGTLNLWQLKRYPLPSSIGNGLVLQPRTQRKLSPCGVILQINASTIHSYSKLSFIIRYYSLLWSQYARTGVMVQNYRCWSFAFVLGLIVLGSVVQRVARLCTGIRTCTSRTDCRSVAPPPQRLPHKSWSVDISSICYGSVLFKPWNVTSSIFKQRHCSF